MTRQIGFLFAALTALVIAAPASAQTGTINGALRLHTETLVIGYQSHTETPDGVDEGQTTGITSIGPGVYGLGFGLGYGVADNIVVGANLVLQNVTRSPEEGDSNSTLGVSLLPYIEVLFGDGNVRPFVGGNLQLMIISGEDYSQTMFGLGGLGGAHIFLADSFSFDVSGRLYFSTGSETREAGGGDVDTDITELGFLILAGVSGWSI